MRKHNFLIIKGVGLAKSSIYLTGLASVASISPSSGSVHGGTVITIVGNGFSNATQVMFGSYACVPINVTPNQLQCKTSDSSPSTAVKKRSVTGVAQAISLSSSGATFDTTGLSFTFSASLTPSVSSVSPTSGSGGQITIAGSGFGSQAGKNMFFILTIRFYRPL